MAQAGTRLRSLKEWDTVEARVAILLRLPADRRLVAMRALSQADRVAVWRALPQTARMEIVAARGAVPEACGPEMPVAPARPGLVPFMPRATMVDAKGQEHVVESGYRGRAAARVEDVFDRMLRRQTKAHRQAHGVLFDAGQIDMARTYRNLVEAVACGTLRGVNLDSVGGGGGDDGAMAVYSDRVAQVAALERRVGAGMALEVRRVRPSARAGLRQITRLQLVRQVCVGSMTLSEVLRAAGWAPKGALRDRLRGELQEALDRMQGYPPRSGPIHKMQKGA